MRFLNITFVAATAVLFSGCAGLDFGEEGFAYYEPKPYLVVSLDKACQVTATVISLPGERRYVKLKNGYGSAKLSLTLSNGMITGIGQETDTKVPETITAIAGLGTAMAAMGIVKTAKKECTPSAKLYPIVDGVPDLKADALPITFSGQ